MEGAFLHIFYGTEEPETWGFPCDLHMIVV